MLDLFILETCPYCRKVMSFLDEKGVKYNKVKMGGKRQVPFLVDTDRNIQMYESDDIIEYLKTVI